MGIDFESSPINMTYLNIFLLGVLIGVVLSLLLFNFIKYLAGRESYRSQRRSETDLPEGSDTALSQVLQ